MKKLVLVVVMVVMASATAHAGLMGFLGKVTGSRTVQTYLPAEKEPSLSGGGPYRPFLYVYDNGVIGYLSRYQVKERSGDGQFTFNTYFWGGKSCSAFYDPASKTIVALVSDKGERVSHAYRLHEKGAPMAALLAAISANYGAYRDYIDDPSPAKEAEILKLADVEAALASVEDLAVRKTPKAPAASSEPGEQVDLDAVLEQAKTALDKRSKEIMEGGGKDEVKVDLNDLRKTAARDRSFVFFAKGEGMSKTVRVSMFRPHITAKEIADGAATKVRLTYVGAWLDAIAHDYRPKVFSSVKGFKLETDYNRGSQDKTIAELVASKGSKATVEVAGDDKKPAAKTLKTVHAGKVLSVEGEKVLLSDVKYSTNSGPWVKTEPEGQVELELSKQERAMLKAGQIRPGQEVHYRVNADNKAVPLIIDNATTKLAGQIESVGWGKVKILSIETGDVETYEITKVNPKLEVFLKKHEGHMVDYTIKGQILLNATEQK